MSKKTIAVTATLIAVFVTAVPSYAQSVDPSLPPSHPSTSENGGFFGQIENFFGNIFHHHDQNGASDRNQEQGFQDQNVTPGVNAPSGTMQPNQNGNGSSDYFSMQQNRVNRLVQQGLITQAQGSAIIAELQKVQTELKDWAAAEGINESYVIGSGQGMGMGEGNLQQQSGSNQSGQNQQFQNHGMRSQGEHGFQQGEGGQGGPGGNFNRHGE
jgi:hypothetical protein